MRDRFSGVSMTNITRREMIAGFGLAAGASALTGNVTTAHTMAPAEYMLEPGLIYLNTGSLGPTPRSILDAVLKAWNQVETNPVAMSYGDGVHAVADKTREAIGGLIG